MHKIAYANQVIDRDIPSLEAQTAKLLQKIIAEKLATDPIGYGTPLRYTLKGYRRLKIGDYRVVYKIDPTDQYITIIALQHRKEVWG